jgi:hypothetical protein
MSGNFECVLSWEMGYDSGKEFILNGLKEYIEKTEQFADKKETVLGLVKKYIDHQQWKLDNG